MRQLGTLPDWAHNVDNGSTFRSKHLQVVCAQLGASLVHSRPYQPHGRGKIERFFRRVRADSLSALELTDDTRLEDLNRHLAVWIEDEHHHVPYHGLDGETPLDRWAQISHQVRFAGPDLDLQRLFRLRFPRRVSLTETVCLHGRTYETDASLIWEGIVLLQDPGAPLRGPWWSCTATARRASPPCSTCTPTPACAGRNRLAATRPPTARAPGPQ